MKRLWLLLVLAMLGASSPDSAVFAPSLVNAIPDTSVNSGASVKLDFKYNIKCSSTASPTTNSPVWSATGLPAGVTLSSVGVLTGIPTASASGIVIKCVNNSSPVVGVSDTFNLTVNAGGGLVAATGYFVDCDSGNNANAGTTYTAPWRTLAWAQAQTRAVGSDLWVKANTTCAEELILGVNGTAANHSIFGTYYVASGVAYQLTPDNPLARPQNYTFSHGARAVLRGTYDASCSRQVSGLLGTPLATTTCKILKTDIPRPVPATIDRSMIKMDCDYCDVQDIAIYFSNGGIIRGPGERGAPFLSNDVTIRDSDFSYNGGPGIVMRQIQNFWFYGNVVKASSLAENHSTDGPRNEAIDPVSHASHGSAMLIGLRRNSYDGVSTNLDGYHDSRNLIEKNYWAIGAGEGIIIQKLGGVIVRGNWFEGGWGLLYTAECWRCVFEYNYINSMGNPNFDSCNPLSGVCTYDYKHVVTSAISLWAEGQCALNKTVCTVSTVSACIAPPAGNGNPTSAACATAIAACKSVEIPQPSTVCTTADCGKLLDPAKSQCIARGGVPDYYPSYVVIRGNVVINSKYCIDIGGEKPAIDNGIKHNAEVYNNTCINSYSHRSVIEPNMGQGNIGTEGIHAYNNIFYNEPGFTSVIHPNTGFVSGEPVLCTQNAYSRVVMDYNLWYPTPANAACKGAHDVYALPGFVGTDFMHRGYFFSTSPPLSDLGLQAGSAGLGAGTPLTLTAPLLDLRLIPQYVNITYPCATFDSAGSITDINCNARGNPPDIGAMERQ